MSIWTFDEVAEAAARLTPEEQAALIARLPIMQHPGTALPLTREQIIARRLQRRAAGAFDDTESLYGRYADPGVGDWSLDEMNAYFRTLDIEWEQELDEFHDSD